MNISSIEDLIARKDWKSLVKNSLPVTVAVSYSFSEAMHIVDCLIKASSELPYEEGIIADLMRDYAVNLMIILREKFSKEWQKDWKNEAFLGVICSFVFRDEEAFKHIKNAYEQLEEPPQSLILAYISAGSRPEFPLSKQEIAELSNKAIKKKETYEAALRMAFLAYEEGDLKSVEYWNQKAEEFKRTGIHTPIITPNVIKSSFDTKCEEQGYYFEE